MLAGMCRKALIGGLLSVSMMAVPAQAEGARYTGTTGQGAPMTVIASNGPGVTFMRWSWRARCNPTGKTVALETVFRVSPPGSRGLPTAGGRFRLRGVVGPTEPDPSGQRYTIFDSLAGRFAGTTGVSGYFYVVFTVRAADGRVVDTCRTGRVGWALRRR